MGKTNNPNGRPKGRPNKITKDLREILKSIISQELEKIPETLKGLSDKERLDVVLKLLPYILPRIEPIKMDAGELDVFGMEIF